jgi:hypothetical protein
MRIAVPIGRVAITGLLVIAVVASGSAGAQEGGARGALANAAISVGYWGPYPHGFGHPMQGYYPRPGPYRDAAQFWKNYQFYYDGCRRPPVRPGLDWDYVLSCYYGY